MTEKSAGRKWGAEVRAAVMLLAFAGAMMMPACHRPGGRNAAEARRPLKAVDLQGDEWQGQAIAYSGYRAGQSADSGVHPTQEQVAEDLRILARNWRLIRVYSADRHGEDVLEVIRRDKLDLKVMLGIWLAREPGAERNNARQIADGIRLANEYEDIVVAVNVGNEVLIEWTAHPVREETLIRYVRQVKASVTQPVTVADNYVWWRDHGTELAREVDFITIHTYPLWERKDIDEALSYSVANYEQVRAAYPGRTIVIGEAGWATYTEGNLHVPRGGGEQKQQRYYEELTDWARANKVTMFFFEAFDEPWKGTGTEGHWGLFTADRKAKPVMQRLYPELMPDGPTSPTYPDQIAAVGPDIAVVLRADLASAIRNGSVNVLGPGVSTSEHRAARGGGGREGAEAYLHGRELGRRVLHPRQARRQGSQRSGDAAEATGPGVQARIEAGGSGNEHAVGQPDRARGRSRQGRLENVLGPPGRVQRYRPVASHDPRLVEPLGSGGGVRVLRSHHR